MAPRSGQNRDLARHKDQPHLGGRLAAQMHHQAFQLLMRFSSVGNEVCFAIQIINAGHFSDKCRGLSTALAQHKSS